MYTVGHYRLTSETSYGTGGQILGRYWSAFICLQGSFFLEKYSMQHIPSQFQFVQAVIYQF